MRKRLSPSPLGDSRAGRRPSAYRSIEPEYPTRTSRGLCRHRRGRGGGWPGGSATAGNTAPANRWPVEFGCRHASQRPFASQNDARPQPPANARGGCRTKKRFKLTRPPLALCIYLAPVFILAGCNKNDPLW